MEYPPLSALQLFPNLLPEYHAEALTIAEENRLLSLSFQEGRISLDELVAQKEQNALRLAGLYSADHTADYQAPLN